jgi:WD40 repeat protein
MGGKAAVWDIRTGKKIHGFDDWWGKFSPDGKYILTYTHEKVTLWDSQKFTKVHIFDGDGWGEFSPDSKYLFTNGGTAQLWIWNLAADYSRHNIQSVFAGSGFTNGIMSISPDSKYIVGMFIDERGYPGIIAGVWDVETGTEVKRFAIDKPVNYGIRITTNSRHVLLGVGDGELQLWDLHTGKKVRQFC